MSNWIEGVRERIAGEFGDQPWVCVMATCDPGGRPRAQCKVCHDIDRAGRLLFVTDRRAGEEDDLRSCADTEIVFWLRSEQAQVRIRGTAAVVDAETDVFMRETAWAQLSDQVQSVYTNDPSANQHGSTMPSTFELIVVSPMEVEVRELGHSPGEKRVWQDTTTDWATASAIDSRMPEKVLAPIFKPTRQQLLAAQDRTIKDVIAPGLRVLFCGINPGLYSGATGNHFARPGNRFWPALYAGGFTPRILHPSEKNDLLTYGCGVTNVVARTTAAEAELSKDEIIAGGLILRRKVKRYRPNILAVLGIGAYRHAFNRPEAKMGDQAEFIGSTRLWVLPNPSGLNAHYSPTVLAKLFRELNEASMAR